MRLINPPILGAGSAITAIAVVWTAINSPIQSFDAYWLLALGRDYLAGTDTSLDLYSFTFTHEEVAGNYALVGAAYYFFIKILGFDWGVAAVRLLSVGVVLTSGYLLARKNEAANFRLAGLSLILLGINYRLLLRPELVDYVLVSLAFLLWFFCRTNFRWKTFVPLLFLIVAWSNLHAAVIGYVIFFGFYLQVGIEHLREKEYNYTLTFLIPSGLILVAAGFINADLSHPVIDAISFSNEWSNLIQEHRPFLSKFDEFSEIYVIWPLALFIVIVLILTNDFGLAVVALIFAISSYDRIRMISFLLLVLGFALLCVSSTPRINTKRANLYLQQGFLNLSFSLLVVFIAAYSTTSRALMASHTASSVPKAETTYLKKYGNGGNIINAMHYGGWLIYDLAPAYKVFIDGRTNILYPIEFLREAIAISDGAPSILQKHLDQYEVDYLLFPNSKRFYNSIVLESNFRAEFISEESTVYSKNPNPLSITNLMLTFPMCWDPSLEKNLANERHIATQRYTTNDSFLTFMLLLSSEIEEVALRAEAMKDASPRLNDKHWRALAYRSLIAGHYSDANHFFSLLSKPQILDVTTAAYSHFKNGTTETARDLLVLLTSGYWVEVLATEEETFTDHQKVVALKVANLLGYNESTAGRSDSEYSDVEKALLTELAKIQSEIPLDEIDAPIIFREHCNELLGSLLPPDDSSKTEKKLLDINR